MSQSSITKGKGPISSNAKKVTAVASCSVPVLDAVSMTQIRSRICRGRGRVGLDEQLFAAEERDAGPIDEFRHVFLGVNQGIVVLDQLGLELSSPRNARPLRFRSAAASAAAGYPSSSHGYS